MNDRSIKVGVLTYHRAINYGAFLQAYGLVMRLNEEPDIVAEIIDFNMKIEESNYYGRYYSLKMLLKHPYVAVYKRRLTRIFRDALKALPLSDFRICSDDEKDLSCIVAGKYDVIICGSDELWKIDGMRGFPSPYWLPGDYHCIKATYAISSRSEFSKYNQETQDTIRQLISSFSILSVRDSLTYKQIKQYTDSQTVMLSYDPSLIYNYGVDIERGKKIIEKTTRRKKKKKTLLLIVSDLVDADDQIAKDVRKAFSDEYSLISVFTPHIGYSNVAVDPFDWLNLIAAADIVCTTLFHGVCFSIALGKPFIAFYSEMKKAKVEDILMEAGFLDRYISKDDSRNIGYLQKKAREVVNSEAPYDWKKKANNRFNEYMSELRKVVKE